MVERVAQREARKRTKTSFIDCDIHNIVPSVDVLEPYLPARWRRHVETFGMRQHHGFASGIPYPKASPGGGSRVDAWPPSGLPPGADLDFMREQHLDVQDIEYGILNCLYPKVGELLNEELGAALARATNDWQIYEAAERHGLPIGIHFAGLGGNPITSSGWPSFYIEDHTVMAQAFQSQVISLVYEGIFERFPDLRVVLMEGGFAWLPSLMWRLDKHWKRLREEVPFLKRPPSEYIREHMWATTQPMEEPTNPKHLLQVIEHLGSDDMLMFSTDYPHWDFDDPDRAFQVRLPSELKQKIFYENARALYPL